MTSQAFLESRESLTSIETIMCRRTIHAEPYPLGDNLLLSLVNGASRMCCHGVICYVRFWVDIAKENRTT